MNGGRPTAAIPVETGKLIDTELPELTKNACGGDQPSPSQISQDHIRILNAKYGLEKVWRGFVAVSYEPSNQPAVEYAVKECHAPFGKGMTVLAARVLWNAYRRKKAGENVMTQVRLQYLSRLSKSISQPNRNEHLDETQGLCIQKASQTVASIERGKNNQEAGTGEF